MGYGNKVTETREYIHEEIVLGNYSRGTALPPEREMAEPGRRQLYDAAQGSRSAGGGRVPGAGRRSRDLRLQHDLRKQTAAAARGRDSGLGGSGKHGFHHAPERGCPAGELDSEVRVRPFVA